MILTGPFGIQNTEWAESPPIFRLAGDQYGFFNGQFLKF